MAAIHLCMISVTMWTLVLGDYACVCNFTPDRNVYASPDTTSTVIGHMYEFDCKKTAQVPVDHSLQVIEIQHKLGYVVKDANLNEQSCPGDPPPSDLVPKTTAKPATTGVTSSTAKIQTTTAKPATTGVTSSSAKVQITTTKPATTGVTSSTAKVQTTTANPAITRVISSTAKVQTPATKQATTGQTSLTAKAQTTTTKPATTGVTSSTAKVQITTTKPETIGVTSSTAKVQITTTKPETIGVTSSTAKVQITTTKPETIGVTSSTAKVQTATAKPATSRITSSTAKLQTTTTKPATSRIASSTAKVQTTTTKPATTGVTSSTAKVQTTSTATATRNKTLTPTNTGQHSLSTTLPNSVSGKYTVQHLMSTYAASVDGTVATTSESSTKTSNTIISLRNATFILLTTTPVSPTLQTTAQPLTDLDASNNPLKYLGVGYHLLDSNPGTMDLATHGTDRGLLTNMRVFQLTQAANSTAGMAREANMSINDTCTQHGWSRFMHDAKDYQDELFTFINDWDTPPLISNAAFTFNSEFNRIRHEFDTVARNTVYRDMVSSCTYGSLRFNEEMGNMSVLSISKEFATDVCRLPEALNLSKYMAFLDSWGTNVVMSSDIGTFTVERYKTNGQQILLNLQNQEQYRAIQTSGGYEGYGSSVTLNSTDIDMVGLPTFGVKVKTKQVGNHSSLVPVRLHLAPITVALSSTYWTQVFEQRLITDECSTNMTMSGLQRISSNMEIALQQYVAYRESKARTSVALTDHPIRIPMVWPYGTYGLMEETSGCPGSKVAWKKGFRKFDTEDTKSHNYFSTGIEHYLAGNFGVNNIVTNFCMKTMASVEERYDRAWPSGSYCLLKSGGCPVGFQSGYIYWDDQDISNSNEAKGSLPDGEYNKNTKINYCCRNDGSTSTPMLLPREKPFVLLRYGDSCQSVFGMDAHELIARWDDEDLFNSDDSGGAHPFDDGGSKDHKLHFCHYRERNTGQTPGIIG